MTIVELLKNYQLHDSMLESIRILNDHSIELVIDVCSWMQDTYKDTDPETQIQHFIFDGVTAYEYDQYDLDSDSILEARMLDNQTLELVVLHDDDGICHIVRISASEVHIF